MHTHTLLVSAHTGWAISAHFELTGNGQKSVGLSPSLCILTGWGEVSRTLRSLVTVAGHQPVVLKPQPLDLVEGEDGPKHT